MTSLSKLERNLYSASLVISSGLGDCLRLAVYLHGVAPYDEALFRGISESDISVHLLVGGKFVDRPYWSEGKNLSVSNFREICFNARRFSFGQYIEYFDPKMLSTFLSGKYDALLVPFGSFTGLFLLFVARLSGMYTLSWCGVQKVTLSPLRVVAEPLVRLCILFSRFFIAYSSFSKRFLIKEGARPERIVVLNPNGVYTDRLSPQVSYGDLRERLGIGKDEKIVLFVGKLEEEKGVEYLIRSMKLVVSKVSSVRLVVVGVGSQRSYLEDLVRMLGIEKRVIFAGIVPNDVINQYYALCDVHVAPSIVTKSFIEPFGMVYQEAMASGKPSVAFDIPAPLREIVVHGKTGYLAPEKDTVALADYIVDLLYNDQKRRLMGANARKIAVEKYDIKKISQDWAKVLSSLVI